MPDVKKVVVEELLELYSLKWEEKELSSELLEAADLLGFQIYQRQTSFTLQTNKITTTKPQTNNQQKQTNVQGNQNPRQTNM